MPLVRRAGSLCLRPWPTIFADDVELVGKNLRLLAGLQNHAPIILKLHSWRSTTQAIARWLRRCRDFAAREVCQKEGELAQAPGRPTIYGQGLVISPR
jgi:hypothetical protein